MRTASVFRFTFFYRLTRKTGSCQNGQSSWSTFLAMLLQAWMPSKLAWRGLPGLSFCQNWSMAPTCSLGALCIRGRMTAMIEAVCAKYWRTDVVPTNWFKKGKVLAMGGWAGIQKHRPSHLSPGLALAAVGHGWYPYSRGTCWSYTVDCWFDSAALLWLSWGFCASGLQLVLCIALVFGSLARSCSWHFLGWAFYVLGCRLWLRAAISCWWLCPCCAHAFSDVAESCFLRSSFR